MDCFFFLSAISHHIALCASCLCLCWVGLSHVVSTGDRLYVVHRHTPGTRCAATCFRCHSLQPSMLSDADRRKGRVGLDPPSLHCKSYGYASRMSNVFFEAK